MRRIMELIGALEFVLIRRWFIDFDCNRAKINGQLQKIQGFGPADCRALAVISKEGRP